MDRSAAADPTFRKSSDFAFQRLCNGHEPMRLFTELERRR